MTALSSHKTEHLDEDVNHNADTENTGSVIPQPAKNSTVLLAGRYETICTIKSGAMGSIYRARDLRLDNIVAVKKMIFSSSNLDEERYAEERFMEEGRLLSELHHEGLPKVIDYFREADPETGQYSHYLVMTFIDGEDLDAMMVSREKKPYPAWEALAYLRQILDILSYLHSRIPPVIYRDLKPSNIMIDNGKAYLVDFGIARIFQPRQKGTAVGTPGYAAPEQYKGFAEPRSDLYSLGVVMHYICTGRDPEDGSRSPFSFEAPKALNPDIPQSLSDIIMSMVQIVPEKRPRSAEELLKTVSPSKKRTRAPGRQIPRAELVAAITAFILPVALCIIVTLLSLHYPESHGMRRTSVSYRKSVGTASDAVDRYSPAQAKKALKDMGIDCTGKSLIECVKNSDLVGAKLLLISGIDPDTEDSENIYTPLRHAIAKDNINMAAMLIARGANVNRTNNQMSTPLHCAAFKGNLPITKLLLSNGAALNIHDSQGATPLHMTADNGKREVAEYLISQGAEVDSTDLRGATPLHYAVTFNHKDVAQLLIAHGADVNSRDTNGATPIFYVKAPDMTELLVSKGADVKIRCGTLATPLHAASEGCPSEVLSILIDKGANIRAEDEKGRTPLHYALSDDPLKILISKGADISAKTKDGDTPLHSAAGRNATFALKALLEGGADINAINNEGRTPLSLARGKGHQDTVKILLEHGARE
ncbi:MAG: ankyrin repeat domain-containing protein [Vulcanimicrobiota bacterium]